MYLTVNAFHSGVFSVTWHLTACRKWEKSDKYCCIPQLDLNLSNLSFIWASMPLLSAVPAQWRAPFKPILYVCVKKVIKPPGSVSPFSLPLCCLKCTYYVALEAAKVSTLQQESFIAKLCPVWLLNLHDGTCIYTYSLFASHQWWHVLPRGIMERYLPRNLLAMVISCHRVQPRWETTWCAAAGGWWLTFKETLT